MKTIFDINKVVYCWFMWENGKGTSFDNKPKLPTVDGRIVHKDKYAFPHHDYPLETEYERALRLDILDHWYPRIEIQFANTHRLAFNGKRAISIWEAWNAKIFGVKKK